MAGKKRRTKGKTSAPKSKEPIPKAGRPVVRVALSGDSDVSLGDFSPLAPPRHAKVDFEEMVPSLLERLHASLAVSLTPGTYSLPLFRNEVLPLKVPGGCRCHVLVYTQRTDKKLRLVPGQSGEDAAHSETIVSELELTFNKPLVLDNILPVLVGLQSYFSDHDVTALGGWIAESISGSSALSSLTFVGQAIINRLMQELDERLPVRKRWSPLVDRLSGTLGRSVREAARVNLTRISGRPVKQGDEWQLELRFTGEWEFFGQVKFPFFGVRVHPTILPAPHAVLDRLLSNEPLASARFHRDRIPVEPLAQELAGMIRSYQGELTVNGCPPNLALLLRLSDDGKMVIDTDSPANISMKASVSGQVTPEELALEVPRLEVVAGDDTITAAAHGRLWSTAHPTDKASPTVAGRCISALYAREWSTESFGSELAITLEEGSGLANLDLKTRHEHPLLKGETQLNLTLRELAIGGTAQMTFGAEAPMHEAPGDEVPGNRVDLALSATVDLLDGSSFDDDQNSIRPVLKGGKFQARMRSVGTGEYALEVQARAKGELAAASKAVAFPEFSIEDGELQAQIAGQVVLDGKLVTRKDGRSPLEFDFAGTTVDIDLENATLVLGERKLNLPPSTKVKGRMTHGVLATSGLGRASIDVRFDMQGKSPLLMHLDRVVELFVPELRQGDLTVHISPSGGITISGEDRGLYDARYFNSLINPDQEVGRLLDILSSDEALDRVFACLGIFSPDAVKLLTRIRNFTRKAREIFDEEEIEEPRDALPGRVLARLAGRLIFDREDLDEQLYPIVKQVTDGKGLNVSALKRLLADHFPEHEYDFEVDRILRLLSRLLAPADQVERFKPIHAEPLAETAKYTRQFAEFPAAAKLYRTVDSARPLPRPFAAAVARIAPYLLLEQVEYLLSRQRDDWVPDDLARLVHVLELKRRVRMIQEGYGGVGFAPQAKAIAFFLGEIVKRGRRTGDDEAGTAASAAYPLGDSLLGPQDIAVLLQAGLASAWTGRAVQLNQRMLLDLVLAQPPEFLRDMLVELGNNDPRVLAGALNGLLDLEQGALRKPLDLVHEFTQRLGFQFPRLEDFLAGGSQAKHSYYEALSKVSEQVLGRAEEYRALKYYLQEARLPAPRARRPSGRRDRLAADARASIAHADELGLRCKFTGKETGGAEPATAAYLDAFAACRGLLKADPHAFKAAWFKQFWARNHEALVVLSVANNVREDVDDVRRWLRVRTGSRVPNGPHRLVEAVIDALYHSPADRAKLKADPLVRLLIPEPEGHYDFTIVSAMGVVTGGAKGTELTQAYRRIGKRRGVRVVRADTATARSLEHNAQRIIDAIRTVTTPWGYVGYSQGCANCLMAENLLMSGPPDQRKLLEGLVCRNLLASAFNATAHGACGDKKFLDTMVFMDHFLAHYQARLSKRAVQLALRAIRLGMENQQVVLGMMGSRSLSWWGVLGLHRGGQFKGTAPTSTMRGIVTPEIMPEALEWLSNVLTHQLGADNHDSQVCSDDAHGHSVLVKNRQTKVLEECDMGSLVQTTHHWSPLKEDTEMITTERDIRQAVYEFPKDRHVFPWVEVNARFGLIKQQ